MTLPTYVEYGSRVNAPAPFLSREGRFRLLVLEGDGDLMQAMVERMLDGPAGPKVTYRSLGSHILAMLGTAGFASQAPGFSQMGFVRETQLSLWLPVSAGHMDGQLFIADRFCMAVPYIFVDNPMSYVGGREDFGFPKAMGRFGPGDVLATPLTIEAFGGNFAPENEARWTPLIEINQVGGDGPAEQAFKLLEDLLGEELPCGIGFLVDLVRSALEKQARHVFLKQFRDCEQPTGACYQAIVEAEMQLEDVQWAFSTGKWSIRIVPLESHPILKDLGIKDQVASVAVDLTMTMIEQEGEVVAP